MIDNTSELVSNLLGEGRSPILLFEGDILRAELERLGVEQGELGRLLSEAMNQSSETWHDNAPADAINHHSRIVAERANTVMTFLGAAVLLAYPSPEESSVTLGSIVTLKRPGVKGTEYLLVTGLCRTLPRLSENAPFDELNLDVATVRSPLTEAIPGKVAGDSASYSANERTLAVEVAAVQQFSPAYLAEA